SSGRHRLEFPWIRRISWQCRDEDSTWMSELSRNALANAAWLQSQQAKHASARIWKAVTKDHANLLESLIQLLNEHKVKYCVIGGQAINAYAEPVVTLDLDLAIAS